MKASEIKVGHIYVAKVSGRFVDVRVDAINAVDVPEFHGRSGRGCTVQKRFSVTNLVTGRKLEFRSAAKFRREVTKDNNRTELPAVDENGAR